jgi:hypothetical protein
MNTQLLVLASLNIHPMKTLQMKVTDLSQASLSTHNSIVLQVSFFRNVIISDLNFMWDSGINGRTQNIKNQQCSMETCEVVVEVEVSGQLHASAALPPGKSPQYQLYRRLDGPQSRSGWSEKWKFLTLPRLELRPLGRPAHSQSLYRLRYPGSCIYCG